MACELQPVQQHGQTAATALKLKRTLPRVLLHVNIYARPCAKALVKLIKSHGLRLTLTNFKQKHQTLRRHQYSHEQHNLHP